MRKHLVGVGRVSEQGWEVAQEAGHSQAELLLFLPVRRLERSLVSLGAGKRVRGQQEAVELGEQKAERNGSMRETGNKRETERGK